MDMEFLSYGADRLPHELPEAVTAFLGCCQYYSDRLTAGTRNGERWVYSNSDLWVPQATCFDVMVASGHFGANCAMMSNWALMDIGAMPDGTRFWGDIHDEFARRDLVMPYLDPVLTVVDFRPARPTFGELLGDGQVKPGDIFLSRLHTFICRDMSSFFACGHDTYWHSEDDAPTEDAAHAVFDSWVRPFEGCGNYNNHVNFRLRIRDEWMPKGYRDADGVRRYLTDKS